jgi:hypothetical protein
VLKFMKLLKNSLKPLTKMVMVSLMSKLLILNIMKNYKPCVISTLTELLKLVMFGNVSSLPKTL